MTTPLAIVRIVAAATLVAAVVAVVPAHAAADADTGCRRDLGKGVAKLSATLVSAGTRCRADVMKGKLAGVDCLDVFAADFPGAATVAKAVDALDGYAERSCAEAAEPAVNGYATCPPPCGALAITGYGDVASCLACTTAARVADALEALYGDVPAGTSRDAQRCQKSIGKAARLYLFKRIQAQQRCQYSEDILDTGLRCRVVDFASDPRGLAAAGLAKAGKLLGRCPTPVLAELDSCAGTLAGQQICLPEAVAEAGDALFDDVYPGAHILWETPAQGAFTTDASVAVRGRVVGARGPAHTLAINGAAVALDDAGIFATTVPTDGGRVFQPVLAEVRRSVGGQRADRSLRTLVYGPSHPLGQTVSLVLGLRMNDTGLDSLEPLFREMVDIDLAALVPPGTLVIDDYGYLCVPGFDCLTSDVVINPTDGSGAPPPSIADYRISVDASGAGVGYVGARIDLDDLFVSARVVELGCDINVRAATATITGSYDLLRDAGAPTQVDVVQLGGVNVAFGGFGHTTDCGDGFGSGLLESLVDLFVTDVESLVRDAFTGFLNAPQVGDDDPPVASAIEAALAGIEIAGAVGSSIGVHLDAPIADIPIDDAGVTVAADLTIGAAPGTGAGQCQPPAGAPDLAASLLVPSVFPPFGAVTPAAGRVYHVGLGLAPSALNQLLAAETECGLLVSRQTRLGAVDLTTGVLALFFPELAEVFPEPRPVHIDIRPELAPVVTNQAGPHGELARLVVGHLVLDIEAEEPTGDTIVLRAAIGVEVGLDLVFDNDFGVLGFELGDVAPQDVEVAVVDNPQELDEARVVDLLQQLLPAALPAVASSLESFPLPTFPGRQLFGVESSRNGDFLSVFADLIDAGTVLNDDYTGAEFGASDIALVGSAAWVEDFDGLFAPLPRRLRLTNNGGGQTGAAWWTGARIEPSANWSTTLRIQITYPTGGGADGMAFHLQSAGTAALPWIDAAGLAGRRLSVVVDTWNNGEGADESLQVFLDGARIYLNDLTDFDLDPDPGSSPRVFRVELGYDARASSLRVAMFDEGGGDYVDDRVTVSLNGFGPSWAGVSAATGGAGQNHDLRTWQLRGQVPIQDLRPDNTTVAFDFTSADYASASMALRGDALWFADPDPLFAPWPQRLRLTGNAGFQNGAAWFTGHRIDPTRSWTSEFRFQTSYPYADGADGLGFHLQADGTDALPAFDGSGLGGKRLSVVVDTWNNGPEAADESLRVLLDGNVVYSRNLQDFVQDPNPGSSPSVFRLRVEYIEPRKELRLALMDEAGGDYLTETIGMNLIDFGPSWAGFSASTGGFSENHDIRTWTLSAVAVP